MQTALDSKRVAIFLAFAFGIAWLTGLVIYLTGGLIHSPAFGGRLTLALLLMSTFYMWSPALANIFTRLVTREGWAKTGMRPKLRGGWPYWLAAWFIPGLLVILGGLIYFLLYPQYFDPNLGHVRQTMPSAEQMNTARLWQVVLIQTVVAMLIAPLVNAIATFGEEFGWRAYLLPKLLPLGARRAAVILGIIWGVWHWPLIFMGYEYRFDYPGWPWLGPLVFVLFTFSASVFLAWVTLRGGSVWPAVIGHAAINGIAQLPLLLIQSEPANLIIGPAVNGVIGGIGFLMLAALLLLLPGALKPKRGDQTSLPIEDVSTVEDISPSPISSHISSA